MAPQPVEQSHELPQRAARSAQARHDQCVSGPASYPLESLRQARTLSGIPLHDDVPDRNVIEEGVFLEVVLG
ncbi:MAG TPA: hypothetical protein VE983_03915 [Solirubrobacteraceae bacterium]|nr:hypothetical protein [Solirubrobacteraceae bacterium]